MIFLVYIAYVVGWFLLCVSGTFTFIAMLRGNNNFILFSVPFIVLVGLPVYFSGNYLHSNIDSLNELFFWIPAIFGGVCGVVAGYGAE